MILSWLTYHNNNGCVGGSRSCQHLRGLRVVWFAVVGKHGARNLDLAGDADLPVAVQVVVSAKVSHSWNKTQQWLNRTGILNFCYRLLSAILWNHTMALGNRWQNLRQYKKCKQSFTSLAGHAPTKSVCSIVITHGKKVLETICPTWKVNPKMHVSLNWAI